MELHSYTYSIPYLIFLGCLCLLLPAEFRAVNKRQSIISAKAARGITCAVFVFFFGLRGFIATDWYVYYSYFAQLKTLWNGGLWQTFSTSAYSYEAGFVLYSVLIKSIYPSYFLWVFVSTAIDIALLHVLFRRYAKFYVLAFLMFFVFGGEIIEFNLMRNVKSILLFLLSLKYLQERRILPYMLLNVLGMSFHITSVIYLPLYFALHREFPKWLLWTVFIVGNVLFLLQVQYIQPLFTFVGNMLGGKIPWMVTFYFSDTSYGISVGYIERTLSFVLIMLLRPALTRQDKSNLLFFNMYVIYAICFLYFGEAQVVTLRISYLFIGAYWFLFPNALYALRKRLNRQIMLLLIVAYSVIKALLWHASAEMEYDNLMFGIKKYEERTHVFHTLDNRQKNE